jgi:hypothetical protein
MAFHSLLQSAAGSNKKTDRKQSQPLSGFTKQAVPVYMLFPMDLKCCRNCSQNLFSSLAELNK